jgi:hypothetical protein
MSFDSIRLAATYHWSKRTCRYWFCGAVVLVAVPQRNNEAVRVVEDGVDTSSAAVVSVTMEKLGSVRSDKT